jgi:MFS family permease
VLLVVGPVSGTLGNRFGSRVPLALGGAIASLGLALLAWQHETRLQLTLFNAVVFAGIGFAFAAMPNLIIDAVEPTKTGEATGFNALVRSVGSSLGSQVTAATLAGAGLIMVAGRGYPANAGFTTAFIVGAIVTLGAAVLAATIPPARPQHASHLSPAEELGASAPLGDPAYGLDEVE